MKKQSLDEVEGIDDLIIYIYMQTHTYVCVSVCMRVRGHARACVCVLLVLHFLQIQLWNLHGFPLECLKIH